MLPRFRYPVTSCQQLDTFKGAQCPALPRVGNIDRNSRQRPIDTSCGALSYPIIQGFLRGVTAMMLQLPDELLGLIARQVLAKEEGLRLWCKLSSTCTQLWNFQLPAEPTYFLDNSLTTDGELLW